MSTILTNEPVQRRSSVSNGVPKRNSNLSDKSVITNLLNRFVFTALLVLIALIALPYGTDGTRWEGPFECIAFGLGVLWLIEGSIRKSWRLKGLTIVLPLISLLLLSVFQTVPVGRHIVSAAPYETSLFAVELLALILVAVLINQYCSNRTRLRALIRTIITISVASALFGILRQTTQQSPGFILPDLNPHEGYGQFFNRNHFAFLMEMGVGLCLGLLAARAVTRDRVLIYIAMAASMWMAVILSLSRGGILSIFVQLIFVLIFCKTIRPKCQKSDQREGLSRYLQKASASPVLRTIMILPLLLGIVFTIFWVGGEPLSRRLQAPELSKGATTLNASNDGTDLREKINRFEIWQATLRLICANSVAGVGFGAYFAAIPQYHDASGIAFPREAHNDYLELLASGGLLGGILGLWFLIMLIRRSARILHSADPFRRGACLGALAGIFAVSIHSFVDFGLHITINALVLLALAMIATVEFNAPDGHRRSES